MDDAPLSDDERDYIERQEVKRSLEKQMEIQSITPEMLGERQIPPGTSLRATKTLSTTEGIEMFTAGEDYKVVGYNRVYPNGVVLRSNTGSNALVTFRPEGGWASHFVINQEATQTLQREEREVHREKECDGDQSREAKIICPFCQTKGSVHIYWSKVKDGGPALWSVFLAPLTFGLSLLFGWQFPEHGKFGSCNNCGQSWRIE